MTAFDAAVLDSGDVIWLNWMCGYDWGPEHAPLPWMPHSRTGEFR